MSTPETPKQDIKIRKAVDRVIIPSRHETLLKNIDYMEAQIGRLAKMARDMRAELLLLTTK
jgi:hypothetical protein